MSILWVAPVFLHRIVSDLLFHSVFFFFFSVFLKDIFIHLFLAELVFVAGRAFSSSEDEGHPLIAVASPALVHSLCGTGVL